MMLYSDKHKIKFTHISENYQVKKSYKGTLSSLHSSVITYVVKHYEGTAKYKQQVVNILNILTFAIYAAEPLPVDWSPQNPFINIPIIDDDRIREVLGDIYLTPEAIDWDITPVEYVEPKIVAPVKPIAPAASLTKFKQPVQAVIVQPTNIQDLSIKLTDPLDLYLQGPEIPQFDINKPFISGTDGADSLVIYTTLPEIPQRQRDISATTDINKMADADFMRLFPNRVIHTRAAALYEQNDLPYDEQFGNIIPIDGYSNEQVLRCIIEYPHLYKLARHLTGLQNNTDYPSFYGWMELNGELVPTMDIWDSLPISKKIPRQSDYIKEYVIRKYLLDRDIAGVEFKFPIYGELLPFLTLVMPAEEYVKRGYDPLEIAKQCVLSRIAFKQSRNPILRRLNKDA